MGACGGGGGGGGGGIGSTQPEEGEDDADEEVGGPDTVAIGGLPEAVLLQLTDSALKTEFRVSRLEAFKKPELPPTGPRSSGPRSSAVPQPPLDDVAEDEEEQLECNCCSIICGCGFAMG